MAPRGEDAERHRHHHGENNRAERQGDRRFETLDDERGDGLLEDERLAQVAADDVREPDAELHGQGTVQAQTFPDLLDLLGRGAVARDDGSRIARHQAQQQKDQHGDHA